MIKNNKTYLYATTMHERKEPEEREGVYRLEEEKGSGKLCNCVNLIEEIIFKTYRREYSLEFS